MTNSAAQTTTGRFTETLHGLWGATRRFRAVLLLLTGMLVYFGVVQNGFVASTNIESLLVNVSVLWVVAMGMTFVILSGGFDLSVGATAALAGIMTAKTLGLGLPGGVVVVLVIAGGALLGGVVNGLLIGRLGLSTFVVTLASMIAFTGVVDLWGKAQSFYVTAPIVHTLGFDHFAGLPIPIWVMAVVFLVALYVQSRTYLGRDVYAIGGSPAAAGLAGIRISRTLVIVYAVVGAAAALGGLLAVGRIGAATPQVDNSLPLQAIAAVLLGGTALTGGAGGVGGTALGVLFIGVLNNGLSLSGVATDWQNVVTGVILVFAVLGDRVRYRGRLERRGLAGNGRAPDADDPESAASNAESLARTS